MNESKKNIEFNNGWILCPSKSFPGKFYYFNVLNGEAAWSLNQSDNKGFLKGKSFHKITDKSHGYPEPTTLPHNIFTNTKKPDFLQHIPNNHQLPKFGQAIFPKYVTNVEPLTPNIVCTSVPFLMFPETEKPMFDETLSEFENLTISQSSKQTKIPLCKRFKNYQKPCFTFDRNNKIVKPSAKFETSTPKNLFLACVSKSQNFFTKTLIKEPTLKLEPKSPTPKIPDVIKSNEKPIIGFSSKVESTKSSTEVPNFIKKEENLEILDSSDLRFLLLAKRRSIDAADTAVERKRPKLTQVKPLTLKKKVTFNVTAEIDDAETTNGETQEDFIPRTIIESPKSPVSLNDKTPPSFLKLSPKTPPPNVGDQPPTLQLTANYQHFNNTTWYIVVDTDVLLLDYELIDKVVLSDPKCRLIIPHAVAADIEALCLGDCHGQQRVIYARQLTRKLATPPPHYLVEPRTLKSDNIVVTTNSILHCCMKVISKNYYVVLITNDPHLQFRATILNIHSYKLNEIKYGVDIKPNITPEQKNIKMITPKNDVTDTKNQLNQSLFKTEITSEEKNIKLTSGNDMDANNQCNNNFSLLSYMSLVKKQQCLSTDSETDSIIDRDKLINVTQKKCLKNIENMNKSDNDGLSDISSEVSSLNLKDKNVFKPQNVKENGFVNFEKRILNPNTVFKTYSLRKTIPYEKLVYEPNHKIDDFQKDILEYNFENTENPFCSTPIRNMKRLESKSKLENSVKPSTCLSLRQELIGVTREIKILNPSQTRIQKIIRTINNDSTTKTLDNQISKTNDSTGLFKIPQQPTNQPIKNATPYTSVHVGNSTVNDEIVMRRNIDSIDENLRRFRIKSRNMRNKIKTRIDEWICSYMQIMEDVLMYILQKNCVCMENTAAPLTLKETLNCIKMLFGSHTKIREFTNKLSELLEKCMLCMQGKSKMSLIPEDFMKIFGYGVLLVQALKHIHPQNEELKEAELLLNNLQTNLESNTKEFDPELVKSPSLSKSEVDKGLEEIRPQFVKKKSFVIDYLKKHFNEWKTYKEDLDDQNHKIENHTDFRVVRTLGKNLNLFKIDNKKIMSLSKNTLEGDSVDKRKDGPELIRLLENNEIIKPDIIENVEINTKNETGTKLMRQINNVNNQTDNDFFSDQNEIATGQEKDVPLKKLIENIEQKQNDNSKVDEEFNYTTHENTFLQNTEKDGPKIIRNIKFIDEIEKKFNNREPLDLDLFYSEIYEPSIGGNIDFDVISEKNKNSGEINKNNHFEDNNYGLVENTMCTLEDFCITPSISPDSKSNNYTFDIKGTDNSSNKTKETKNSENITSRYFTSVSEKNDKNEEKTEEDHCEVESETYTENQESQNESCIGNGNSGIHNENSEKYIDNSKTPNNDSGTHLDNSETSGNYGKTVQIVRDDSTNDSGFENDSTHAHSLVKIFLSELSTTFKVIHTFVAKFIDEIRETELSGKRKVAVHNQASKALEDMVAIIQQLRSIIKRESAENTVLKMLLRNAGVEATTDKRMTRYRQIVIKCLGQAVTLESALKVIVSTTLGDFEALSTNAETLNSNIRYFNIFE